MKVRVTILVSSPPSQQQNMDSLKYAALKLTNNKKSIQMDIHPKNDRYALITNFTMKTAAQYKVVDNISRTFKFELWDLAGYQDMIIEFPK